MMFVLKKTFLRLLFSVLLLSITSSSLYLLYYNQNIIDESPLSEAEYCDLNPDECINKMIPANYEKILSPHEEPITDNQLNKHFFHTFQHHFNERVPDPHDLINKHSLDYRDIMSQKIDEPKYEELARFSEQDLENRAKATFITLLNDNGSSLKNLIANLKQIESSFNDKFHYPINIMTMSTKIYKSSSIKKKIQKSFSGPINFILIKEDIFRPIETNFLHFDNDKSQDEIDILHLNRFYSGPFYNLKELFDYEYYWRLDNDFTFELDCDISYDIFKFMKNNEKTYGFFLNLYNLNPSKNLWDQTVDYLTTNVDNLSQNASYDYLLQDLEHPDINRITNGYSSCSFFNKIEIGQFKFFRDSKYLKYFNTLDENGGFYNDNWKDSEFKTIALSLFEDLNNIHWFRDLGMVIEDGKIINIPKSDRCKRDSQALFEYEDNCMMNWIKYSMNNDFKDYIKSK